MIGECDVCERVASLRFPATGDSGGIPALCDECRAREEEMLQTETSPGYGYEAARIDREYIEPSDEGGSR